MDSVIQKRIFVGNIFHNADDCYSELLDRFGKFGDCQDFQFEKHNHFAFIDIRFNDEADFNKLRKSFNNVKFKGNILKVDEAKPNWETTWAVQHAKDLKEDIILNAKMKKKNWQHYKKMENVAKSWKDHKEVIAGRMREAPRKRSQLRNITFRINVNGSLKVYKCYKTKLWGYERNKELNDLVYKFTNNFWKNGYNHIVDRLDYSRAVKTVRFKNGLKQLTVSKDENVCSGEMDSDENMSEEEKEKNNVILNDLLKDFDFDKPMTLNDSDEELLTEQRKGEEEEEEEEEKPAKKSKKSKGKKKDESEDEEEEEESDSDLDEEDDDDEFEEYVLATLSPKTQYQQTLDLTIAPEEEIQFIVTGSYAISLVGNYIKHPFDTPMGDMDDSEDEDGSDYDDELSDSYYNDQYSDSITIIIIC